MGEGLRNTEAVTAKVINGHLPFSNVFLESREACSAPTAIHSASEPLGGRWKGTQAQRTKGCREKQVLWKGPAQVPRCVRGTKDRPDTP